MGDLLGTLGGLLFSTGGASGHGSSRARCLGEIFFQLHFPPGSLRTHQKEVFRRPGALTETRKFSLGKKIGSGKCFSFEIHSNSLEIHSSENRVKIAPLIENKQKIEIHSKFTHPKFTRNSLGFRVS